VNLKNKKVYSDNQHAFIPFVSDTFGFLAPDAFNLLQKVQKIIHNNVVSTWSMDVVFKKIDILPYIKAGLTQALALGLKKTDFFFIYYASR
jgi:hypothetical protein